MTMWRVTVSPREDTNAWETFVRQGVIGIGWPKRSFDDNPSVRKFREIHPGDWVVAHVPKCRYGESYTALAVGRVLGSYHELKRDELPPDDHWDGDFRRQYRIEWHLCRVSLAGIIGSWRQTVYKLSSKEEQTVLDLYELNGGHPGPVTEKHSLGSKACDMPVTVTKLRDELHRFYVQEGIAVDEFDCRFRKECANIVQGAELWSGSEAHVGARYGDPFRIVVVSMDRGDGAEDVWTRTKCIESLHPEHLNPHMRGTLTILASILPDVGRTAELWQHFAMTNSAKCCYKARGMKPVPPPLYANCTGYTLRELAVLKPDILITQGNLARCALKPVSKPFDTDLAARLIDQYGGSDPSSTAAIARRYLSIANIQGRSVLCLHACHPSARRKYWNDYERRVLPLATQMLVRMLRYGNFGLKSPLDTGGGA